MRIIEYRFNEGDTRLIQDIQNDNNEAGPADTKVKILGIDFYIKTLPHY